jgi:hypothetical protein
MQYHSSVAWQTSNGLLPVAATIDLRSTQHILDLSCHDDFGALCLNGFDWTGVNERHVQPMSIKLGTVIPIPIESLTLSPNPVVGGTNTATGTITLQSRALMDIPISLKSSEKHVATVPDSVTVPQGQTSATFVVTPLLQQVETQTVIEAFYGQGSQQRLTVLPPS